ncbi:ATP-binding cassette domain-containing protein [Anaerosoma tenue]|uniref:ATP-binding cassette domain-containing protein n=1 Tax=Anaerosoma tenue TaxID=2933588 RepID=UPI002260CC88|nr:ATP-binding cassette domain-containing protein [Anaerosoma tenue]MCK8115617.1 ATP-binding cassette domain-containing protein [Anaerosoma tenue]
MIVFEHVGFTYPGAVAPALDDVSVSVSPGQVVALLGPNGSGKSTLARLGNGLLVPSAGVVRVDGTDTADEETVWDVRSRVGFIQQNPENQIVGTLAEEDVAFGPENLGVHPDELRVRVDDALAAVGLSGFQRREPHLLSEGQKQRLAIAGALAMRPSYLIADEPTAMLDPVGRRDVLAALGDLRRRGVGILHVTHHLADVVDADEVVVLRNGRIAYQGTPKALMADPGHARTLAVEVPPEAELADALRRGGVPVPDGASTPEAIAESVWRS